MKTLYIAAAVLLGAAGAASAQTVRDGDVNVNVFVNYGFAYRDNTWVPVEIQVRNTKEDIKGHIELETLAGLLRQNPTYRLPLESARNSHKRFQMHCHLAGTTEVRVQIYNGRRRVLDIPYTLQVQPIPEGDLLGLVLDDNGGAGFGFLYMAVNRENRDRGFHRECLENNELAFLSDLPQSYDPIDVIIVGESEVERIGLRSREMIRDFVRCGGRLAVCTGKNARLYRGTWLEELLGVQIGTEETIDEATLAADAFPPELRTGAREDSDCVVARLTPVDPEVTNLGQSRVLATRRPYGRGAVYTLAVDAEDGSLQNCEGYAELWREISLGRPRMPEPAFAAATAFAAETLPQISGIEIHSKTSVMTYLALYFLVGVVGNWLFFSWLRRREWAWAALVVFSLGFTGYAMVFGTTGRARVSELEQIDVVRIPPGGGTARRDTLLGVLTAHTTRYDLRLRANEALAQDTHGPGFGLFGGSNLSSTRPFILVQGDAPRVEDLRVGASELRMIHIESDAEYPGGFEGRLRFDGERIQGRWTNRTGRPVERAFLLFDGRMLGVTVQGDELQVDVKNPGVGQANAVTAFNPFYPAYPRARESENVLLNALPLILFTKSETPGIYYNPYRDPNVLNLDRDFGPMLCAWSPGTDDVAVLDASIAKNVNWTLILEEVEVEGEDAYRWKPLQAWVAQAEAKPTVAGDDANAPASSVMILAPHTRLGCGETRELKVAFAEEDLLRRPREIQVDLYWVGPPGHTLAFRPEGGSEGYRPELLVSDVFESDGRTRKTTYRFPIGEDGPEKWDSERYGIALEQDYPSMARGAGRLGPVPYPMTGMEEYGLNAPPPHHAEGKPIRMLSGFVGRLPEETPCSPFMNNQHVFYLAVRARAGYTAGTHQLGDVLPWR